MNWKKLHRAGVAGLIACAALWSATAAAADRSGDFDRLVVFGDSLSDPGNAFELIRTVSVPPFEDLIPSAPYARGGLHFSNGETWIEQLASDLNAKRSSGPAFRKPLVFSNYAVGGARAGPTGAFTLSEQVEFFLIDSNYKAPPDALYVVFVGGNDIRDALGALELDPTTATSLGIIAAAVNAIRQNLIILHAAGARTFLVLNVPDIGRAPAVRLQGEGVQGVATLFSLKFNKQLDEQLGMLALDPTPKIIRLDVFGIINKVVDDPGSEGLTEVERPCITLGTQISPFCAKPDDFLFWDGIHPTRAGHGILARRAGTELGMNDFNVRLKAARGAAK
jgi:phospholipase/lecithinase/hemolysin